MHVVTVAVVGCPLSIDVLLSVAALLYISLCTLVQPLDNFDEESSTFSSAGMATGAASLSAQTTMLHCIIYAGTILFLISRLVLDVYLVKFPPTHLYSAAQLPLTFPKKGKDAGTPPARSHGCIHALRPPVGQGASRTGHIELQAALHTDALSIQHLPLLLLGPIRQDAVCVEGLKEAISTFKINSQESMSAKTVALGILKQEAAYRTLLCLYMIVVFTCITMYMQTYPHTACVLSNI